MNKSQSEKKTDNEPKIYSQSLKNYASFVPGTMVKLTYRETGKGFLKNVRKNCKVIGTYDFHILLLDLDKNMKISITKSNFFTDPISISLHNSIES